MMWSNLVYEWTDLQGDRMGHYDDGSDEMIEQNRGEAK